MSDLRHNTKPAAPPVNPIVMVETLVNSPGARAIQFIVSSVMMPVVLWGGTHLLSTLDQVQTTLQTLKEERATNEVRVQYLETRTDTLTRDLAAIRTQHDVMAVKLAEAEVRIAAFERGRPH